MAKRRFVIMNAACGISKTLDDAKALAKTKIDIVVIGSATVRPRTLNSEPAYYTGKGYSLNSFGMPNGGLNYYQSTLPEMIDIVHRAKKRLALNIAGFNAHEYQQLAQLANSAGVDLIELNLSCPNTKDNRIISFSPSLTNQVLKSVAEVNYLPLHVKLSPYSNPAELVAMAKLISKHRQVSGVCTGNSFPNGLMFDGGRPALGSSFGGLGGAAMLPVSLGQVSQFRKVLPKRIKIIGIGGVQTATDVELYRQAGANGVQAASLIMDNGPAALNRLFVHL